MPDPTNPAPVLARISSDAASLHQALCALPFDHGASASALAARITDAQDLAGTALRLFLALSPHASRPTPTGLLLLQHVAQIAKAAQDAAAELAAALARAVENQRRQTDATSRRVVLIGPTPQQFIESAADLVDRIPALCDAVLRDRPQSPCR
ncbi:MULTISPECIES: hypothetical protein [Streptomyces]|uniref:hypothetical protein n=1 Tax=Streptomyces TaxID=1883 RepID=UPI000F744AD5|nr:MULTISPECIES: hypothetical protein [Streptomyces]MBJ6622313.1 hypothetical protein [Streptomyces sp. DHE17-7]RSS66359.1 hypothetical protein EF907_16620 [Streptomyces sp. WAC06273]GGZ72979.1 hypothetical protein GCM10010301_53050 [Streptomyces plicatus]GHC28056.1 hypothetical protein GCM10010308_51490 [Streptomyces vinaceusdrappus]